MGICASANAAPPAATTTSADEGEVEGSAPDANNSGKSKQAQHRAEAEDDFSTSTEPLSLEELGVQEATLQKVQSLKEKEHEQLKKMTNAHFQDNDDMDAAALGSMLGLSSQSSSSSDATTTATTTTTAAPPLFLRKLHGALRRVATTTAEGSDAASDVVAPMGITHVVEALLHVHGCGSHVGKRSDFLYEHVYKSESADVSEVTLEDVQSIAKSMVESGSELTEFRQEMKALGMMSVEGSMEEEVEAMMVEYLKEHLGEEEIVPRKKFQKWIQKCGDGVTTEG